MSKNEMIVLPREVIERALDAWARECPPDCKDGMTDSGGVHPWGEAALIECPSCQAVEALRAALEQPDAETTATVPEGWKLVPKILTEEMEDAGCEAIDTYHRHDIARAWEVMLNTAPQQKNIEQQKVDQEPYLYYDPENGDTWTQEAINDGLRQQDGLIALYTK